MQDAYAVAIGVDAASNNEDLDFELFEAITDNEDEANEIMQMTNSKRFMNRVRIENA